MNTTELLNNLSYLSGGYTRPNIYDMVITPPEGLETSVTDLRRVSMNCSVAGLPGRSIATLEYSQGGEITRKIPHSPIMSDLNTTFYLSLDLFEKRFFDAWQDMIYHPDTGALGWYDDYVTDITITKKTYDSNHNYKGSAYTFHEAYPIVVGDVIHAYEMENQIGLLQVVWAYREWSYKSLSSRTISAPPNT